MRIQYFTVSNFATACQAKAVFEQNSQNVFVERIQEHLRVPIVSMLKETIGYHPGCGGAVVPRTINSIGRHSLCGGCPVRIHCNKVLAARWPSS